MLTTLNKQTARRKFDREMEEEAEILEPYKLEFSDLILLSSSIDSSELSSKEIERLESISRAVMEDLGPTGPGLLEITGVPNASTFRRQLLPIARKLALLNHEDRKRILKDNGLGSDVPLKNLNRSVSSFAMQLKYEQDVEIVPFKVLNLGVASHNSDAGSNIESHEECGDNEFEDIGNIFKGLGFCMMELGLCLARICDRSIGGHELEKSLLESGTAKGRLIHYHSTLDNHIMKESCKTKKSAKRQSSTKCLLNGSKSKELSIKPEEKRTIEQKTTGIGNHSTLWQQWHYDYGIFTVLTSPMFMYSSFSSCDLDYPSPSGHTYLQIFDPHKKRIIKVKSSPESFIIQVGESADVLSNGKLRSTLHSVCRPEKMENLSRETFVVFLQPSWHKTFSLSNYPIENLITNNQTEGNLCPAQELEDLTQIFSQIVPPLSMRLKDGMTFAEFSRETTKQYYGGSGMQSNR